MDTTQVKKHAPIVGLVFGILILGTMLVNSCNGKKVIAAELSTAVQQITTDREQINAQAATIDKQATQISRDSVCIATYKTGVGQILTLTATFYQQVNNAANNLPK